MMPQQKPVAEITAAAVHLLCKELGPVNTARFLNQFTGGSGDYTRDRRLFLGNPSVKELAEQSRQLRTRDDRL